MSESVADIAFLANSTNRVAVLRSLGDGPHSRHVIMERTDVARVTLGRILDDLESRRWITQTGQVCDITSLGSWVLEEFTALCAVLDAERQLRSVIEWFPEPGFGFHIRHLADAEITRVNPADASAPITALVGQLDARGAVRAFSFAITSQFLSACWRHVVEGEGTYDWVFTGDVLDVLRGSAEMASQSREMLESGRAAFYLHDGPIPYVVVIADAVNLRLADEDGAATALIQSDDEAVRDWAVSAFERYRDGATPLDPDAFEA